MSTNIDLTNELTIVIPVRIDCRERKENLDTVIHCFLNETSAKIIVLEADKEQLYNYPISNKRLLIHFVKDDDPVFHRTRYLNQLLKMSETNIVGIWDTDVILKTKQIIDAVKAVKSGATLCYPYDGRFVFLNQNQSEQAKQDVISFLSEHSETELQPFLERPSAGGAFVVNRQRYIQSGGENENFYGWGPEDTERLKRMEILEEPVNRIKGELFHLYHPRGINSIPMSSDLEKNNTRELINICQMNKEQLMAYIGCSQWNTHKIKKQDNNFDSQPLVSVIMPVYNNEKYVSWAIESILRQSYKNFEFIIINDGSTDSSTEQIKKFDDKRIVFINQAENKGNYRRRNEGIALSKGKYICVMDADDEALPFRLATQIIFLEKHELVLAIGSQFEFIGKEISNKPTEYEFIKTKLLYNNVFLHPSLMIRKDIIDEIGGYNEEYHYSSDYDLVCRIAIKGEIINLPDILMRYRTHNSQISTAKKKEQQMYADMTRINYLKAIGFSLTDKEFKLFNLFMNHKEFGEKEKLEVVLDKIVKQNKKHLFFKEEELLFSLYSSFSNQLHLHSS
jgi:glycosyltransferase involved in cell wall biosynthesis